MDDTPKQPGFGENRRRRVGIRTNGFVVMTSLPALMIRRSSAARPTGP